MSGVVAVLEVVMSNNVYCDNNDVNANFWFLIAALLR
jgi:hypothetical protein